MKIFVSYSRRDATHYVEHIYGYLKDFSHDVFTDKKNIRGGEVWSEVIENNISICDYFVIIITPASLNSSEVEKEVLFAIDKEKMIIPWILKPVINNNQIKWGLNEIQGIEFTNEFQLVRDLHSKIAYYKSSSEEKTGIAESYSKSPQEIIRKMINHYTKITKVKKIMNYKKIKYLILQI